MSETAQTIIKAALRGIGVIAPGETPTDTELQDGLESLKFLMRALSANNLMIPYTTQETLTMTGATYYTIGSGGDLNTVRPTEIRGAWTAERPVGIIDEARYRQVRMSASAGAQVESIWYSPEYPLGKIYPWPTGGTTLYIDSLKPLTAPTAITTSMSFPPEYDNLLKWNLMLHLAPEYGREPSQVIVSMAASALRGMEQRNLSAQMMTIQPDLIKVANARYDIDYD